MANSNFVQRLLLPPGRDARLLRALYAELLGTLFFQLTAGLVVEPLAVGAAYAAFVWATQNVSGGHLNPAISLATAITGHFHWVTALLYTLAQSLGAILGSLLQVLLVPAAHLGSRGLSPGCFVASNITDFRLFGWEFVLTFALVWVLYAVGVAKPGHGSVGPLALGLTLYVITLVGLPYSGSSFNPARVLANALVYFCNDKSSWVYIGGQVLGGAFAAAVAGTIFGFGAAYTAPEDETNDVNEPLVTSQTRTTTNV